VGALIATSTYAAIPDDTNLVRLAPLDEIFRAIFVT